MSQEKVDKRKAEKANRKKQISKKKQKRVLNIFVSVLVTVAFLAIVCLAAASLSGKFDKETEGETISFSVEELSSLQEALGMTSASAEETTQDDAAETTTAEATETTMAPVDSTTESAE